VAVTAADAVAVPIAVVGTVGADDSIVAVETAAAIAITGMGTTDTAITALDARNSSARC